MKKLLIIILVGWVSHGTAQADLNLLQLQFGKTANEISIPILPDANNYYQDINGGGSRLGNLTKVIVGSDSLTLFNVQDNSLAADSVKYPDLAWQWWINDSLVSTLENPTVLDVMPSKSGVQWMEMRVFHKPTGVWFERGKWCYLQYNAHITRDSLGVVIDNGILEPHEVYVPRGETRPNLFGVFIPFLNFTDDAWQWARMVNDVNRNGRVTSLDLTLILSGWR